MGNWLIYWKLNNKQTVFASFLATPNFHLNDASPLLNQLNRALAYIIYNGQNACCQVKRLNIYKFLPLDLVVCKTGVKNAARASPTNACWIHTCHLIAMWDRMFARIAGRPSDIRMLSFSMLAATCLRISKTNISVTYAIKGIVSLLISYIIFILWFR